MPLNNNEYWRQIIYTDGCDFYLLNLLDFIPKLTGKANGSLSLGYSITGTSDKREGARLS